MKICSVCGKGKATIDFGSNKSHRDGLHHACLLCERQRDRSRKQAKYQQYLYFLEQHPGYRDMKNKEWRLSHK